MYQLHAEFIGNKEPKFMVLQGVFSDLTQCNFYQFLPPSFFSYINNGSFMLVWRGESQLSGEVVDLGATSLGKINRGLQTLRSISVVQFQP